MPTPFTQEEQSTLSASLSTAQQSVTQLANDLRLSTDPSVKVITSDVDTASTKVSEAAAALQHVSDAFRRLFTGW